MDLRTIFPQRRLTSRSNQGIDREFKFALEYSPLLILREFLLNGKYAETRRNFQYVSRLSPSACRVKQDRILEKHHSVFDPSIRLHSKCFAIVWSSVSRCRFPVQIPRKTGSVRPCFFLSSSSKIVHISRLRPL